LPRVHGAMDSRAYRLVLLLLALGLSGCAGDEPAASGGAVPDGATGQAPATREVQERPVQVQGTTATGGCAYAFTPAGPQGTCQYEGGEDSFVPLEGGEPVRLAGTLAWTASGPSSRELSVYILVLRGGNYLWDEDAPAATGPSPLAFDFDLSAYNQTEVAVGVGNTQAVGVAAGYVAASTPQDFALDAVYSSAAARA
jgi:hypothetical protein